MRKLITLFSFLLLTSFVWAQESDPNQTDNEQQNDVEENIRKNYKHWSIVAHFGSNKMARHVAHGDWSANSPLRVKRDAFGEGVDASFHADLAVRYMINTKFGLQLQGSYDKITPGSQSKPFNTELSTVTLQGVLNLGTIMGFRNWMNRVNLLGHGGMGVGLMKWSENELDGEDDYMSIFTLGVTPQVRITNWLAANLDLSIYGTVNQDNTTDGTGSVGEKVGNANSRGFTGMNTTFSVGLSFYLGDTQKEHADWYDIEEVDREKMDDMEERIAQLEEEEEDIEPFVLPTYLERENLDSRYLPSEYKGGGMKDLLDGGYVNVYFKFDKTDFEDWSVQWVHYVYQYMIDNPDVHIEILGYADELGPESYNDPLSMRRAEKIKGILVALGINENRLTTKGMGEDASVDKNNADARKFMRRVNFRIK